MTEAEQPEALRLADELAQRWRENMVCPELEAAAELRRLHAENERLAALMYEELRAAIDDGHESMTHADALAEITAIRAENVELRAQLEAIGAGGVSGPLMGQPQEMPDLSALTERGAKAWAGVDAQGLRDGVASAGSEPVAWQYRSMPDVGGVWFECSKERADQRAAHPERWEVRPLYTHPSPPEGAGSKGGGTND